MAKDDNPKAIEEEEDDGDKDKKKREIKKDDGGNLSVDIMTDNQVSDYAKRKLKKYKKLGSFIERSRSSDLCIVTMQFPRAEYTSYEYMRILQSLRPKKMNNLIFVRGNQDQVLTFSL